MQISTHQGRKKRNEEKSLLTLPTLRPRLKPRQLQRREEVSTGWDETEVLVLLYYQTVTRD